MNETLSAAPTPSGEGARVRSMTGFGEEERVLPSARLRVEVRTVNHRFLNVQVRTPPGLERHEAALERRLREFFVRGHVKVSVVVEGSVEGGTGGVPIDLARARSYVEALRALQAELGVGGTIEIATLARFRDVFQSSEPGRSQAVVSEEELVASVAEAARRALETREEEGARLALDLEARVDVMEQVTASIERRAPERLVAERDRLREAVRALLEGETPVEEERIAREIAHLAERWDIHEEVVRFRSHLTMFRETLFRGDSSGIGKRLGFIAQELLREANTMGSKANDAQISASVVTLKEEIERLREQLENVE